MLIIFKVCLGTINLYSASGHQISSHKPTHRMLALVMKVHISDLFRSSHFHFHFCILLLSKHALALSPFMFGQSPPTMVDAMPPEAYNRCALPPHVADASSIDSHPNAPCHATSSSPPAKQSKNPQAGTSPSTPYMNTQSRKRHILALVRAPVFGGFSLYVLSDHLNTPFIKYCPSRAARNVAFFQFIASTCTLYVVTRHGNSTSLRTNVDSTSL